jgi:hypothetical protein
MMKKSFSLFKVLIQVFSTGINLQRTKVIITFSGDDKGKYHAETRKRKRKEGNPYFCNAP